MGGGGSGGGGAFSKRSPEQLRELVRKAEHQTTDAVFEANLAKFLGELLGAYNARDTEAVSERLEALKAALEKSIDGTLDYLFGGSVAKRTYVDGLSDVDSLLLIDDTSLERKSPQTAIARIEAMIKRELGNKAVVSHGRMAITVEYPDGMVLQLLPAVRTDAGLIRVPSSRRDGWSSINPVTFQEALTRRNKECDCKLVPMIKLAKAINGQLPDAQRLSGYHLESLAIAAFRGYDGETSTAAMLPAFFERARALVLSPIVDSTGQSVHVDEYLGPTNSEARQAAGHLLGRLARRMRNATAAASMEQWQAMFET